MLKNEVVQTRLLVFGLALVTMAASLLVVRINTLEISLAYLALLAGVILIGLSTNLWGGLAASAVAVFAIILINQYAGIYPRENRILNIASEIAIFLIIGPLAGILVGAIDRMQKRADQFLTRSEELMVHDETLGTLKPEWSKVRLEEEIQRAKRFSRPLSCVVLQIDPKPEEPSLKPATRRLERIAALQSVIRIARAITQPPVVVGHAGGDQVLVILPENTAHQAYQVVTILKSKASSELFFPDDSNPHYRDDRAIGKPLHTWGTLRAGIASLNGDSDTGETLLARARSSLG